MLGKTILTDILWMGVKLILMRLVGSVIAFLLVVLIKVTYNQSKGKVMKTMKQVEAIMPGLLMHGKAMMESTVPLCDVFLSVRVPGLGMKMP